jgi:hypothetical protein
MNIDSLIDRLRPMSTKIEQQALGDESFWVVSFPASADADYRFCAYIYEDGEAGISAVRAGAEDDEYFWGVTFESPDFDSIEEIGQLLVDTVSRLLGHDTRILQSKGLINVGFECAYADDDGWHSVGGRAALRFSNFVFPKIAGQEKEYRASAVRPS